MLVVNWYVETIHHFIQEIIDRTCTLLVSKTFILKPSTTSPNWCKPNLYDKSISIIPSLKLVGSLIHIVISLRTVQILVSRIVWL